MAEIRELIFNIYDRLSKNNVNKHVADIQHMLEKGSEKEGEKRVNSILQHATKTTPYYKQFSDFQRLQDFPVLDKETISIVPENFLSSNFKKEQLSKITTSGSYGVPMEYYFTRGKKARRQAEVIYYNTWAGFSVGDRHLFYRVKEKPPLVLWMQNEVLVNPTHVNEEWLEGQRKLFKRGDIKFIIGYPSTVDAVSAYCLEMGDDPEEFSIEGIIVTSEPLFEPVRERAEKAFGCKLLARYGTEEFGVLAHECPERKNYHLNFASYIIEILKVDIDEPTDYGEAGRVIVTDLYSKAMPLIRYDIGDIVIKGKECGCGRQGTILEKIEGREVETIFDVNDSRISPYGIIPPIRQYGGIKQFRFIQKGKGKYVLLIKPLPSFQKENENKIKEKLKGILGEGADIDVRFVEDIPALPSGKRPYVISEYTPST